MSTPSDAAIAATAPVWPSFARQPGGACISEGRGGNANIRVNEPDFRVPNRTMPSAHLEKDQPNGISDDLKSKIIKIQHALSISLAGTDDLREGLKYCLDASLRVCGMECGGIYLFDNETGDLNLKVHKGFKASFINSIRKQDNKSELVHYVKAGRPIYTLADRLHAVLNKEQRKEGLRTLATIPLFARHRVIGCLNIASHQREDFNDACRLAVESIAAQAGNVIARLQSTEALKESEEHLKSLMLNAEQYALYRLAACEDSLYKLKVVFVSPSVAEIMGLRRPYDFDTWFAHIHPDDRERIIEASLKAFETNEFNEMFRIFNPNSDDHRWVHSISRGVEDHTGKTAFVNGIMIDITEQKTVEKALVSQERELKRKTDKLEAMNTTLRFMVKKTAQDKLTLEQHILSNIKQLIIPNIKLIKNFTADEKTKIFLNVIQSNTERILSSFSYELTAHYFDLSPTEIQIADLIRQGKKSKEIARIRSVSHKTVEAHRMNIRKKLGLNDRKANLQTYLTILGKNKKIVQIG